MKAFSLAAALFGAVSYVDGHSWVECSQYTATISGQDYDSSSCTGYPRSWADYGSSSFGEDRGANYQPGGESATEWCPKSIGSSGSDYSGTYTSAYPLAEYSAGDTIRIVWPAKNHANYECFGNIPDFAMKILMNPDVNPDSDPTALDDWVTVHDWHDEAGKSSSTAVDDVPFTNCPSFCDDTDRAVCYGDLTLDSSLFSETGYYTFMWYWAFNGDDDIYTMCWEAYVDTNGAVTNVESGEDSDADSGASSSDEYLVQIPICYDGADYDKASLIEGAENLYADLDWSVVSSSVQEGSDQFNATLQTHTADSPSDITGDADNDDHKFCDEIQTLLGDDGSHECYSCSDVEVYTTNEYSSSGGNGDGSGSAIVAVVIVLVIVLIIIGFGIGYQKMQEKKKSGNNNQSGMGTHMGQTNQTHAIAPVQDTR